MRFAEPSPPARNAGEPSGKPSCVTPSQQKSDGKMETTDHDGVAMNLEEQERKKEEEGSQKRHSAEETIDPEVKEAMNNPPKTGDVEGGTPV